ncbi:MAG: hypothetical protein A2070_07510 [Bdellovibrionales bacterium GWC1_52_8]|nr:MAG: hypothetical protein A2070_07510 [Bdellovibrionales bacterium GWC1_52_8]
MEAAAQKFTITIQGLAVLSAIPLVGFALWSDYYGRRLEKLKTEKEGFDKELESARIRLASVSVIIFQLILLFGSVELRRSHALAVNGILVSAVLIQGWMQALAERKLGLPQANLKEQFKRNLLGLLWISTSVLGYITVVLACTALFGWFGQVLGVSKAAGFIFTSVGAISGLIGGMALNFALAPIHLRKLIPSTPLEAEYPILAEHCRQAFRSCGLATPALLLMAATNSRGTTAFISGFRWGRGPFRPALFISRELIEKLTPAEVQAVIFHEMAHVLLNHMAKRFLFSSSLVAGLTIAGVALTLLANRIFPADATTQQLTSILALISFFGAFRWIGHQSQKQEVEADYFAVTRLTVDLKVFAATLRKLDNLNGVNPDHSGRMHPSTELRIAVLEHVLGSPKLNKIKSDQDSDQRAA